MANIIKYKHRRYFGFAHPVLTWEYHCFGYRKAGNSSRTVSDGYETNVNWTDDTHFTVSTSEKSHIVRHAHFKRHEEYPKTAAFVLLEILMGIVSRIRVFIAKFFLAGFIILYLSGSPDIAMTLGGIWLALYGASAAVALAGSFVRSSAGLDQKMDDLCEENGWMKWSKYKDE